MRLARGPCTFLSRRPTAGGEATPQDSASYRHVRAGKKLGAIKTTPKREHIFQNTKKSTQDFCKTAATTCVWTMCSARLLAVPPRRNSNTARPKVGESRLKPHVCPNHKKRLKVIRVCTLAKPARLGLPLVSAMFEETGGTDDDDIDCPAL